VNGFPSDLWIFREKGNGNCFLLLQKPEKMKASRRKEISFSFFSLLFEKEEKKRAKNGRQL